MVTFPSTLILRALLVQRHRGERLKVPSGRWHIRAIQEAIPQKMSQNYIYAATRTKN